MTEQVLFFSCPRCFLTLEAESRQKCSALTCPACGTQVEIPGDDPILIPEKLFRAARVVCSIFKVKLDSILPTGLAVRFEQNWDLVPPVAVLGASILLEQDGRIRVLAVENANTVLLQFDPEVARYYADFVKAFLAQLDQRTKDVNAHEFTGYWVLANLLERKPTTHEIQTAMLPLGRSMIRLAQDLR